MTAGRRRRAAGPILLLAALAVTTGRAPAGARPVGSSAQAREGWRLAATWPSAALPLPPTAFESPSGIAVDPFDDLVLVVDSGNDRVQVFDRAGGFVRTIGGDAAPEALANPRGVALSGGRVFVADTGNERVAVFSIDGVYRGAWSGLAGPWGVATSPDGRTVFVSENRASRIAVFGAGGERRATWGVFGGGDALNRPEGLAVLPDGRIVVANTGNQRLSVFDAAGVAIDSSGPLGAAVHDVVVAPNGTLWSTESGAAGRPDAAVSRDTSPGLPARMARLPAAGIAGVAVAADGTVFTSLRDDTRPLHGVRVWRGTQLIDEWGTVPVPLGLLDQPMLVAGRDGLRIVDRWRRAQHYDLDGQPVDQAPIGDVNDVAATADGVVVVRDAQVERIGTDGSLRWRAPLPATGGVPWARALHVDAADGAATVLDVGRQRLERFDAGGGPAGSTSFQSAPGVFTALWDLAPRPGGWWVVNRTAGTIEWRRGGDFGLESAWTVPGQPLRVASDDAGNGYVLNRHGWVWRYDDSGALRAVWRVARDGAPSTPTDLTVDARGRVVVVDSAADEVTVWQPDPAAAPGDVPSFEPRCAPRGDKRALPTRLVLGERTTVTLQIDGDCPPVRSATDIVLVLDVSGSMIGAKLDAAKAAATAFLAAIDVVEARTALVAFNQDATLEVPLTSNPAAVVAAVAGLQAGGGTDIARALTAARQELTGPRRRPQANAVVVLLTDGGSDAQTAQREAELTKLEGGRIFTVGFGAGVNEPLLRDLASSPGDYAFAPDAAALEAIYRGIAERLAASVLFRSVTVVDEVPANMRYVDGSGQPAPAIDGPRLVWRLADVPLTGTELRYELEPTETGVHPTNVVAVAEGNDGLGAPGRVVFPVPVVEVVAPTATTTARPSATPTATPTTTGTPRPTPVPRPIYLPVAARGCEPTRARLAVVLALDTSSSMTALTRAGRTKLEAAVAAARTLLDALELGRDEAALVQFDHTARLAQPFTADRGRLDAALAGLQVGAGTRLDLGLVSAAAALAGGPSGSDVLRAAVVLTDGRPTGTTADAVAAQAAALRATGAEVYAIGLGDDVDAALLQRVASRPTQLLLAPDAEDLERIFRSIARDLPCDRRTP